MMNLVYALIAKGAFPDVIEGVDSKNFHSLRSCVQDLPLPSVRIVSLTYGL